MDRWQIFLGHLDNFSEVTLVGPFAAARERWPVPAIFIDSGARHKTSDPLHFSVGDGDSSTAPLDLTLPQDKDFSDLAFVLKALPQNLKRLSMVGFLGGRRDHELLNLGEVHRFLSTRKSPTECDLDWSVCALSAGEWILSLQGVFSVVVFEPTMVQLLGCRFTLPKPTLLEPLSSHGLSNEAADRVTLKNDKPVFIFKNPFI